MYYALEHRTGKEVGAVFPQAYCLTQIDAHRLEYNEFPSFHPELRFELDKKAKLTHVLSQASISAHGLLISSSLKEILNDFHLTNHQYFKATVQTSKGEEQYYWLHLVGTKLLNYIDYKLSKFYRTEYGYREEDIELESFEDYRIKKALFGKMGTIDSETIFLKSDFPKDLDLFVLPLFDNTIYISEPLMLKLKDKSIKGLHMKPASNRLQINGG